MLEVGPGTGYYSLSVAEWLTREGRLDLLDHTMRRHVECGLTNRLPTQGDARALAYADDTFDATYTVLTLGEVPDQEKALRELRRVLKPDGRPVVGELFGEHTGSTSVCSRSAARADLPLEERTGAWLLRRFSGPASEPIAEERPCGTMTSGMGTFPKVRAVALLAAAATSLHELRYLVGYGGQADEALAGRGHAYLAHAGSLIGVLLAVAVALFLGRLHRVKISAEAPAPASSLPRLWLAATLALVVVYIGQEGIEGLLAPGHLAGLAGIVGHGGWTAFVFAPLFGALVALLVRGSDALIERVAAGARPRRGTRLPLAPPPRELLLPARIRVLARNLAGRAPPTSARS